MSELHQRFPAGFQWGTATSSYQIEGAWDADGKGPSIWDTFCQEEGRIQNGDTGKIACDHYHRYPEDIALMADLGVYAYRFSINWPRLFPEGAGQANEKGFDFYARVIDKLLEHNIDPWVTFYHWELPQALHEKGGWNNRDIVGWFTDYAMAFVERFGDRVNKYIPINEPSVTSYHGYLGGLFAPGIASKDAFIAATHYQNMVHGSVTKAIHAHGSGYRVGSAYTHFPVFAENPDDGRDIRAAKVIDAAWSRNFLDAVVHGKYPNIFAQDFDAVIKDGDMKLIQTQSDFVGINHYNPYFARHDDDNVIGAVITEGPDHHPRTDIGWVFQPESFRDALLDIKENYGNPDVYITENGVCENSPVNRDGEVHDFGRIAYYKEYIEAMAEAVEQGANVRGYFAWSFMDNFEWLFGYSMRFGMVHVDYDTLKRTPKKSFEFYKDLIRNYRAELDKPKFGT